MSLIAKERIKDVMITRTAIKCLLPIETVERIIDFQGKDALNAVKHYNEVEFVGFGKFLLRQYKVVKRIENLGKGIDKAKRLLEDTTSENRTTYLSNKIAGMEKQLEYLKGKIHE